MSLLVAICVKETISRFKFASDISNSDFNWSCCFTASSRSCISFACSACISVRLSLNLTSLASLTFLTSSKYFKFFSFCTISFPAKEYPSMRYSIICGSIVTILSLFCSPSLYSSKYCSAIVLMSWN
ncbi:hypothetical protein D1872_197530 [compost metagenome]